jgi:hypothetical protein
MPRGGPLQYKDGDDSWVEGRNQRYREVPGKLKEVGR